MPVLTPKLKTRHCVVSVWQEKCCKKSFFSKPGKDWKSGVAFFFRHQHPNTCPFPLRESYSTNCRESCISALSLSLSRRSCVIGSLTNQRMRELSGLLGQSPMSASVSTCPGTPVCPLYQQTIYLHPHSSISGTHSLRSTAPWACMPWTVYDRNRRSENGRDHTEINRSISGINDRLLLSRFVLPPLPTGVFLVHSVNYSCNKYFPYNKLPPLRRINLARVLRGA